MAEENFDEMMARLRAELEVQAPAADAAASSPAGKPVIVTISRHAGKEWAVHETFEKLGYEVHDFSSADQANNFISAAASPPAAVIADNDQREAYENAAGSHPALAHAKQVMGARHIPVLLFNAGEFLIPANREKGFGVAETKVGPLGLVGGEDPLVISEKLPEALEAVRAHRTNYTTPKVALIAEDEPEVAELMEILLQEAGYQVHMSENAEDISDEMKRMKIAGSPPALLVTDYGLKKRGTEDVVQSGLALLREAKQEFPDMPAMMVTGNKTNVTPLLSEGENYTLLEKPLRSAVFMNAVETLTAKKPDAMQMDSGKPVAIIAEDHEPIRELLAMVLRPNYEVVEAEDAIEGLKRLAELKARGIKPALLMTDCEMDTSGTGAGDGDVLVRAARAEHPDLPIVMATGMLEDTPDRLRCQQAARDLKAYFMPKKEYNAGPVKTAIENAKAILAGTYKEEELPRGVGDIVSRPSNLSSVLSGLRPSDSQRDSAKNAPSGGLGLSA